MEPNGPLPRSQSPNLSVFTLLQTLLGTVRSCKIHDIHVTEEFLLPPEGHTAIYNTSP